jgi:hypothetical protein
MLFHHIYSNDQYGQLVRHWKTSGQRQQYNVHFHQMRIDNSLLQDHALHRVVLDHCLIDANVYLLVIHSLRFIRCTQDPWSRRDYLSSTGCKIKCEDLDFRDLNCFQLHGYLKDKDNNPRPMQYDSVTFIRCVIPNETMQHLDIQTSALYQCRIETKRLWPQAQYIDTPVMDKTYHEHDCFVVPLRTKK